MLMGTNVNVFLLFFIFLQLLIHLVFSQMDFAASCSIIFQYQMNELLIFV